MSSILANNQNPSISKMPKQIKFCVFLKWHICWHFLNTKIETSVLRRYINDNDANIQKQLANNILHS